MNSLLISNILMNSSFFLVLVAAVIGFFTLLKKFRFKQDDKEIKSSSSSLQSPSASVSQNGKHNVFPSFHGADVRKAFLSHILESFKRKGIDPFIDNNIERSKSIGPELIEAIRASKIVIVLLSKNYASSSWCLDELAEIMNCREVLGQIVMTIFYEVDPTDIRKQTGDFGKAFRKTCKGKKKEHIERWRKALEDVAKIAGEHSRNWENEAAMIEKIATDVSNMLNMSTPSRDFDSLVGMRAHMEEMEQLLCLDLDEVRMIGIWGPLGIGKTTIARFLFNQVSSRFQLGAIMVNIKRCYPKPCLDEYSAQLQLQNQMLSLIINHKDIMVSHLGVAQERLKDKKVLLVLDDVDRSGQLIALAKESGWFGPGSRIIITTEDLRVLNAHRINHIYKVKFPSSDEAFEIFCMHAFGQKYPYDGFYELVMDITYLAGKLPLGLKILGSALRGTSKQEWKSILPSLKVRLDGEIESIIKFSYDALSDEEKDIFLYVACLFYDQRTSQVVELLEKKFSDVRQSLHILAEKSLISLHEYGIIQIHTLLQQFGRETSRKQYIHGLAKRQLLVTTRDICDDTIESRQFIGIKLNILERNENISEKALERMSDLQFINIYNCDYDAPPWERLQCLLFRSQKIRSLRWIGFQNTCFPSTFNSEFLVELAMTCSKLEKLWEGTKPLRNLKWMDMGYSQNLKELCDLSTATNLEELILEDCSSLIELSIGNATNLETLILEHCSSLLELSFSLENPTNLKVLNLKGCSSLGKLPPSIKNATNLEILDLHDCTNLVELPSIGNSIKLEKLDLHNCASLVNLWSSIDATNLQTLSLNNCSRVVQLPAIENATNLQSLFLKNCSSLVDLPPSIGTATNLEKLDVSGCSSLMKVPSSIGDLTNLQFLDFSGCSSLLKLPSSIGDITNLKRFDLSNCSSLVEFPSSIGNLQQLAELMMSGCSKLEALPTNINLESLDILDLKNCSQLRCFPEISTNIRYLAVDGTAIKEVPLSIMSWYSLSNFHISYFEDLKKFPHALDIITELFISEDIQDIAPWIKEIYRLQTLRVYDCNSLTSIPQLSDSICSIDARNCKSLERLDCSFNNQTVGLTFANCFKLNKEARGLIMHTSTRTCAMLPGAQVPTCFDYRASAGGSLTIKLNEMPLSTSLRFKACITLVKVKEETKDEYVHVMVKQNDLKDLSHHYIHPPLTEHIYTFEIEAREVTSTKIVFEFKTYQSSMWEIGECGLLQILEVPLC